MSAPWNELDRRDRGTRFVAITARGVLNSPKSTNMPFWSINPYIGCEFGCAYCYARDTHAWTVQRATDHGDAAATEAATLPPGEAFEKRILVKTNAAERLASTLTAARLAGEPLVIGTATDPYQPAERRFGITRSLLRLLLQYHGLHLGIITKSTLIARDADLLARLARQHRLTVNLSLAGIDRDLIRHIEPRTPIPEARLRTMQKLVDVGVRVGLLIAPILPGITDGEDQLRQLISAAASHGAAWAAGSPLRMGPATRRTLFPWLVRQRPDLVVRYQRHYGTRQHVSPRYQEALDRRIERLRNEAGLVERRDMRPRAWKVREEQQIALGL